MSQFPLTRIFDFVAHVVPFDQLSQDELDRVVRTMEIAYHPRGEVITRAGREPVPFLHIIHSGSVKLTIPADSGEDILVDIRGEGDLFGAVSLLQSKQTIFDITALEDLLVILFPKNEFLRLVDEHDEFQRYFSFSLARNFQAIREAGEARSTRLGNHESIKEIAIQMHSRVSELMSVNVLTCPPLTTIRQAAEDMTRQQVGSIVVTDATGYPMGLVTDSDLRSRVLAAGLGGDIPVARVMSEPPIGISPRAFAFEAMLEMTRQGIHHLLATEGETMVGVISDHDIRVLTGSTPVGLAKEIDRVTGLSELNRFPERIHHAMEMLKRLDCSVEYMMNLLSEFTDRLTLKLIVLVEKELEEEGFGPPPENYSCLALGKAGRREQVPPFSPEYVFVYEEEPADRESRIKTWFSEFTQRIAQDLASSGLGGGVDSPPPKPLDFYHALAWREQYLNLIRHPDPAGMSARAGIFDFRMIKGERTFLMWLREVVRSALDENPSFLGALTAWSLREPTPLGFLRRFVVEKNGRYTDRLDLDGKGILPIVNLVRVLALDHRIPETGTLARLAELTRRSVLPPRLGDNLKESFGFMTMLKISHRLKTQAPGLAAEVDVDPGQLTTVQRKMLRDSFNVIGELQTLAKERFPETNPRG